MKGRALRFLLFALAMAGFVRTARADEPPDGSVTWLVGGVTMVGITAALETATVFGQRTLASSRCHEVTCGLTWGAVSLLEPTGASFLAVWGWQRGDRDGHRDRGRQPGDHRTMRNTGTAVALGAYAIKTIIFAYAAYQTIACTLDDKRSCSGEIFSNAALVSLVLTPPLALGAVAAGYGTGYERGKSNPWLEALQVQPVALPGGGGLAFSTAF